MNEKRLIWLPLMIVAGSSTACIVAADSTFAADGESSTIGEASGSDTREETESGDGDPGDGDGEPASGDGDPGDGDPGDGDGDGDGDPGDGDPGDGDPGDDGDGDLEIGIACEDQNGDRAIVPPRPGDLLLTKIMPNPSPEPDSTHEWFEVYARYPVDLNQLQIGEYVGESELVMLAEVLTSNTCLHLEAGSSVMFSISDQNDLEPDFTTPNLYLNNSDGSLVIAWGGTTLDSVRWETAVDGETLCRTKLALNKPMWMWRPIGVPC